MIVVVPQPDPPPGIDPVQWAAWWKTLHDEAALAHSDGIRAESAVKMQRVHTDKIAATMKLMWDAANPT